MFMKAFGSQTYALLRITAGFMFLWHGSQKLFSFPAEFEHPLNALMIVGGVIELVGGVMVLAGFMTRWAAFLCSGMMAAAYWMAHGLNHPLPFLNHGELAALYCFVFLFISAHGAGIWSVDGADA